MAQENSAFVWIALSQVKLVLHERQPELFHDKLSRELGTSHSILHLATLLQSFRQTRLSFLHIPLH